MICGLVSVYFDSPQFGIQQKQNSRLLIQRYDQFWFFRKRSGNSFHYILFMIFQKNVSYVILTDQIPLPDCLYYKFRI